MSRTVAVLLGLLFAAAPAQAAERIVVRGDGARALIERAPFSVTFTDARGRPVLRHVEARTRASQAAVALEPEPLGTENVPDNVLYAPLTFEVGGERSIQFPASSWTGNNLLGARAGVQHATTDVVAVQRAGRGVRLEVATTDPERRVIVTIAPDAHGTMGVRAEVTPGEGVSSVSDAFASARGEAFRGFGGRHEGLDHAGKSFLSWIEEENFGSGPLQPVADVLPGSGKERYMFPGGPMAAYYVQNLFVSSRGYGFLLDRHELARWRLNSGRDDAWSVNVAGSQLDYLVAPGRAPRAIRTLSALNGRHRVPPRWSQGTLLWRAVKTFSGENAQTYSAKMRQDLVDIDAARERFGMRVSGYSFEGAAILEPEFLKWFIDELRRREIHPIMYQRAYVSEDQFAAASEERGLFQEVIDKGLVATTPAGTPYLYGSPFLTGAAVLLDFSNPDTVVWWKERIKRMLDSGADGFMQDFGEQVQVDMRFHDGSTGAEMHNRYPNLYHRATREAVTAWERENPERGKVWFFTRAGFSGRPGSAAFEGGNFPGDETTDWSVASGLGSVAPDMLNRAVGGAFGYTTDIGGYADFHTPEVTEELFVRWTEWAALSPHLRVHNSSRTGTKMPWSYGDDALRQFTRMSRLHDRAAPLTRRLWRQGVRTGIPPTRPLWLQFPGDPEAAAQTQQWMLGPDVLVAPVVEEGARERRVYFPRGCWRHGQTGERFTGRRYATVAAPLGRLPWFVRCGTRPFGRP